MRKLLTLIDKRSMGKVDLVEGKGSDRAKIKATRKREGGEPEEVVLKATGKAIEKVLGLAVFFEGAGDCRVRVKTGTVGVIDDIIEGERRTNGGGGEGRGRYNSDARPGPHESSDHPNVDDELPTATTSHHEPASQEQELDLPESWVRKASVVEVAISLR